jgi:uncharacterized protein YjbJ (UPF0337 family)
LFQAAERHFDGICNDFNWNRGLFGPRNWHCLVPQTKLMKIHGGGKMNKDTVKGTIDDAAGRAKRQVGEWTGNTNTQVEGAGQQIKGKAEKAWGNVKDVANDANSEANREQATEARERERREAERRHHEAVGS